MTILAWVVVFPERHGTRPPAEAASCAACRELGAGHAHNELYVPSVRSNKWCGYFRCIGPTWFSAKQRPSN